METNLSTGNANFVYMSLGAIMRLILLPFSWIYGGIVHLRNIAFDFGFLKSLRIPGKSISIGNLSVGGTGKSPHTLYINQLLKPEFQTAILSRGYGRKTKGLRWAKKNDRPSIIGDEPKMFQTLSPEPPIVVAEKRVLGVNSIREELDPSTVILLDDAFQHRYVRPGYQVLLTDYNKPFFEDHVLPAGRLREFRKGYKRSDMVVLTKCPPNLTTEEQNLLVQRINHSNVHFSYFEYDELKAFHENALYSKGKKCLLVCGIAQPEPLINELQKEHYVETLLFSDHHPFGEAEIGRVREKFGNFADDDKMIVITDKDAVKWVEMRDKGWLNDLPIYVQSIKVKFYNEDKFKKNILQYVRKV